MFLDVLKITPHLEFNFNRQVPVTQKGVLFGSWSRNQISFTLSALDRGIIYDTKT